MGGIRSRESFDNNNEWGFEYKGIHVIGKVSDLDEILALNSLDEIAITLSISEYADLEADCGLPVKNQAFTVSKFNTRYYNNMIPTRPYI